MAMNARHVHKMVDLSLSIHIAFALFLFLLFTLGRPALLQAYSLSGHYTLPDLSDLNPRIPGYDLPLELSNIANYEEVKIWLDAIGIDEDAEAILRNNGFVVRPWSKEDDIVEVYTSLRKSWIPVFITSDSLLHLYHVQFDTTLMKIEKDHLFADALLLSQALFDYFQEKSHTYSGDLAQAAQKNAAFFAVGKELLGTPVTSGLDAEMAEKVNAELSLIRQHQGFADSPLFTYKEDYSQYVPRGHYTRSDQLEKYFLAMMWYGRMAFLVKGDPYYCENSACPALIPPEVARLQTLQAALIADALSRLTAEGRGLDEIWDRIYTVTAFYVGLADDLTPHDYLSALEDVFSNEEIDIETLARDDALFADFQSRLDLLESPLIYSGTGFAVIDPVPSSPEMRDQTMEAIRDKTKGMRIMGQRFVPDSFILSQLVFPYTGRLTGDPCFTCFQEQRALPRGLDVMSLLGSRRAKAILKAQGDTAYEDYESQWKKMADLLADLTPSDWQRNLYWGWLYCLKPLFQEYGEGYQTFMKTGAWQDKQLNAALASWTELRHDTILSAKQSYTGTWGGPPHVVGYVEPVPEVYARLLALSRMTREGLKALDVLEQQAENRLVGLETILDRLIQISLKQLENEPLTDGDYYYINEFGELLESLVQGVSAAGLSTLLVADVHTDQNSGKVLEEAVGYAEIMLVAYEVPDGRILLGAGPVFSYYEFKRSMQGRLTDELWSALSEVYYDERVNNHHVNGGFKRPAWTFSYAMEWECVDFDPPPGSASPDYEWRIIDRRDQAPDLTNIDLSEFDPVQPDAPTQQSRTTSKAVRWPFSYTTFAANPFLSFSGMPLLRYPTVSSSWQTSVIPSAISSISHAAQGRGQPFSMPALIVQEKTFTMPALTGYYHSPWSLTSSAYSLPISTALFENFTYQVPWTFQRTSVPNFLPTPWYVPVAFLE